MIKKLLTLIIAPICCASISPILAQDKYTLVRKELSSWDQVRGKWIADSYEALESGHAVPDRMFEEDLTPAELFQLAPEQTRRSVQNIIAQHPDQPKTILQAPPSTPTVSSDGIQRVGLEDRNSRNPSTGNARTPSGSGSFNGIFRNTNCNLVQGRSYGDPHIRSFDGSTFSFQTVGEYVLAQSRDGQFEVQARQSAETDKVSLNSAVAMNVAGDQVGIYAQNAPNRSSSPIRVNGQSVFMDNGTYYLPSGGTIQMSGKKYIVTWPTGERVQADMISSSGRRFLNLSVFVYNCYGDYYGVLGNANGNRGDDFVANGRNMSNGIAFAPFDSRSFDSRSARAEREQLNFLARDFGGQFLVNDRTSLFEYDFGYSSWSFVDPTFPRVHLTMADISSSQRERARQECIRQGIARDELSACIMDFSHANMAPTPRTSAPDRVSGRSTAPVDNPRPNVNRREAGGGQGVRTPWGMTTSDEGLRPTTRPASRERVIDTESGNVRTPIDASPRQRGDLREGEIRQPIRETNTESVPRIDNGNREVKPSVRPSYERRTLEDTATPSREMKQPSNIPTGRSSTGTTTANPLPSNTTTPITRQSPTMNNDTDLQRSKPSTNTPTRTQSSSGSGRTGIISSPRSSSPSPSGGGSGGSRGGSTSGGSVGGRR